LATDPPGPASVPVIRFCYPAISPRRRSMPSTCAFH